MAVGMDLALPSTGKAVLRQPAAQRPPQSKGASPAYGSRPPSIQDSATQSLANTLSASSYGAGQMAKSDMDRAGVSRGSGHGYYGDIAQASADAKAQASAAGAELEAASLDAKARSDQENTLRAERTANAGLLETLRNSASSEGLAARERDQGLYEAIARGMFGLNSMNLDTTSLLEKLLRG